MTVEQIEQKADEYAKKISKGIYFEKGSYTEMCLEQGRLGFIEGYHECFKDCAKSRLNVTTISDCPNKDEVQLEYARTIIKDLLFNSDEYARQRAIDFLKEIE